MASGRPVPSANAIRALRALAFPTCNIGTLGNYTCGICMGIHDHSSHARVIVTPRQQKRSRYSFTQQQHYTRKTSDTARFAKSHAIARNKIIREGLVRKQSTTYNRQDTQDEETIFGMHETRSNPSSSFGTFATQSDSTGDNLSKRMQQDLANISQSPCSWSPSGFQQRRKPTQQSPGTSLNTPSDTSSEGPKHFRRKTTDAGADVVTGLSSLPTDLSKFGRNPQPKLQEFVPELGAETFQPNSSAIKDDTRSDRDGILDLEQLTGEKTVVDSPELVATPLSIEHKGSEDFGSNPLAMLPYLVSDIPSEKLDHSYESAVMNNQIRRADLLRSAVSKRYRFVSKFLRDEIAKLGIYKGLKLCESTIEAFVLTQQEDDLLLALLLYRSFSKCYRQNPWSAFANGLVKKQLDREHPFRACLIFLYHRWKLDEEKNPPVIYAEAQQYLQQFCADSHSNAAKIDETIKVIEGTVEIGISPSELLVCPLVRDLCRRGSTEDAEMILNRLSARFNFEVTFLSLAEIVRGFVQSRNWTRIDKTFSRLHEDGLSRGKVYGFAALVVRALEGYQWHKSPEQIYDFLTYYVESSGLVPTSQLSLVALDAFIRAKRFDLIKKWVLERRIRFSAVDAATSSTAAALRIGTAWHEIGASSEDILQACIALARGHDRDPFSKAFRGITAEAVSNDISRRIEALIGSCSHSNQGNLIYNAFDLRSLFQEAEKLIAFFQQQRKVTFQQKFVIKGLLRQMEAAQGLDALFRGQIHNLANHFREPSDSAKAPLSEASNSGKTGGDTVVPDILKELNVEALRAIPDISYFVNQYYLRREKEGLSPDHGILRHLASMMPLLQREREAVSVIEFIAQSEWIKGDTGTPFGIDIFEAWLRLLLQIKNTNGFREVLWAMIDSDAELKISTRFLLLIRIAAPKLHDQRLRHANEAQLQEMEYLKSRLYRRAWEERGRSEQQTYQFGPWEMWKGHSLVDQERKEKRTFAHYLNEDLLRFKDLQLLD